MVGPVPHLHDLDLKRDALCAVGPGRRVVRDRLAVRQQAERCLRRRGDQCRHVQQRVTRNALRQRYRDCQGQRMLVEKEGHRRRLDGQDLEVRKLPLELGAGCVARCMKGRGEQPDADGERHRDGSHHRGQ